MRKEKEVTISVTCNKNIMAIEGGEKKKGKKINSLELIFGIISVPLAGLAPLLQLVKTTLSGVDCCSGEQRRRKLDHFILHQA